MGTRCFLLGTDSTKSKVNNMCDYALEVAEIRKYSEECRRQYRETGTARCPYEKGTLAYSAWMLEIRAIKEEIKAQWKEKH